MSERTMTCERCGAAFGCAARSGACWCAEVAPVAVPSGYGDCLCPACLGELAQGAKPNSPPAAAAREGFAQGAKPNSPPVAAEPGGFAVVRVDGGAPRPG